MMNTQRAQAGWRRYVALPAAVVGLTGGLLGVGVLAASASSHGISGSNFEILDGDTAPAGASTLDWDSLNLTQADALTARLRTDLPTGNGDDSFGNGTKEDTPVPTVVDGSIPPNKSDLKEFGSWVEKRNGDQFLHLFWTRVQDPSGTTNMDFEFNQATCTATSRAGCTTNGVTPNRTPGDLLITYDLSRGGTQATISLREWQGSAWSTAGALDPTKAVGSINTTSITSALTGATYSPRTFGEASINLDLIFASSSCRAFGSAYLKSRSSDSFTSALKDFIAPIGVDLTNCGRLVVHKHDQTGAKLAGAGFTVTPANSAAAPTGVMQEVSTGVFCLDSLRFGASYSVRESQVPANHTGDLVPRSFTLNSTDNSGTCAGLTTTTDADETFVNTRNTGSILLHKVKEDGSTLLDGAAFTAQLVGSPSTGVTVPRVAAGVFCLDGLPTGGTYAITESQVPAGYNPPASIPSVLVSTASTCTTRVAPGGTPDRIVQNDPAPGRINIAKTDDGTPALALAGAQFTLFKDTNGDGAHQPATETDVQGSPQTTDGTGAASFLSVPLGKYCVVETRAPDGYATAPTQCTTVGLGATAGEGQTKNLSFIDPRHHKVIVLVCHEGTNTLVSSSVTRGTESAKQTVSAAQTTLNEAALCGLGGATYSGLGHSPTQNLSVTPGH